MLASYSITLTYESLIRHFPRVLCCQSIICKKSHIYWGNVLEASRCNQDSSYWFGQNLWYSCQGFHLFLCSSSLDLSWLIFSILFFLVRCYFVLRPLKSAIDYECSFYRCQFDPVNGGEMTQLEYHNFLKPEAAFWRVIFIFFHFLSIFLPPFFP